MPEQATRGQPWWIIVVLALLTSTVPSYMSYLASKRTIDESGKDVGVASVDQTRAILEPAIMDLSRRVGELSGRLEAMQGNAGVGAVAVAPHTRPPDAAAEAARTSATPDTDNPNTGAGATQPPTGSSPTAPARHAGLSASPRPPSVLPKRARLTPEQLHIRQEISRSFDY